MTETKPKQAALYVRISKDSEQNGLGVERQEDECRQWADKRGWIITELYSDNDVSAYTGKPRPDYERMVSAITAGEHDAIVAWAPDRLTRQVRELLDLAELAQTLNLPIGTVQGDLDMTTPSGRTMAIIAARFAQQESETKGERHKAALRQKRNKGLMTYNRRQLGWVDRQCNHLHPVEAPRIAQAAQDIISGKSLNEIAREWNEAGFTTINGKTWGENQVYETMTRHANFGIVSYQGVEIAGVTAKWTPILSRESYDTLRAAMTRNNKAAGVRRRNPQKNFLTSCLVCDNCGGTMAAQGDYYKCNCYRAILKDDAEHVVIEHLAMRLAHIRHDQVLPESVQAKQAELAATLERITVQRAAVSESSLAFSSKLAMLKNLDAEEAQAGQAFTKLTSGNTLAQLLVGLLPAVVGGKIDLSEFVTRRATIRERIKALTVAQKNLIARSLSTYRVLSAHQSKGGQWGAANRIIIEDKPLT